MKFGTLLVIIVSVLIAGILAGLFLKYVTARLVHGYRKLFLKPKLLKLYQHPEPLIEKEEFEKEAHDNEALEDETPQQQTSIEQSNNKVNPLV